MQAKLQKSPGAHRSAHVFLFAVGILILGALHAAETTPPPAAAAQTPAAVPDAEDEDEPAAPPTRTQRVQAALTQAMVRLRDPARKDDDRFFAPPTRQKKVIDSKEVEVRYTKKTIEVPIYEYESYKTIANVQTGESITAAGKLTTVVRQRIKRQIGTREVEQLIADPKGEVVVMVKQPIYGPGGPNLLYPGFYGENAICLLACIKCGVPLEDELFARTAQRLADYLDAYGPPDRTWDVAWLTVAFANLPQTVELNKTLTERMVRKLLLGQVADGPGAGLWGPVAIHPTILARMVEYERKVYERKVEPWEEKLKLTPDRKHYQEKLDEGKALVNGFREQYGDIAQQGLQFEHLREVQVIPPRPKVLERLGWQLEESAVYGLPVFIYGEEWTDVETTSLVLFALREAQVNGCLPEKVTPPMDLDGNRIGEPVESGAAIEKAFAALAKLVDAKGMCPEGVFHTPVHAFDRLGVLGVPVDAKTFQPVAAKATLASTVQGQAGLMDAEQLVAGRPDAPPLIPKVVAAQRNVRQIVKTFLTQDRKAREETEYVTSYDFILQLTRSLTSRGEHPVLDRDTWRGITDLLLAQQLADGAWRDKGSGANLQAALRECVDQRAREYMQSLKGAIPKRQPGWTAAKEEELIRAQWRNHYYAGRVNTDLVSTAYSALLLCEGLRSPVMGVWAWDGKQPRSAPAAQAVKRLAEQNHVRLRYAVLAPDLAASATEGVPVLYISGTGRFAPADAGAAGRLAEFLEAGGLLLVEYPANDSGRAFADGVRQAVLGPLPSFQASAIVATEKMPEIEVINDEGGRVCAVFLPSELPGAPAFPGALKPAQTKEACFQMLLGAVDPTFLRPDYAIDFGEVLRLEKQHLEDEMAARQKALEKAPGK